MSPRATGPPHGAIFSPCLSCPMHCTWATTHTGPPSPVDTSLTPRGPQPHCGSPPPFPCEPPPHPGWLDPPDLGLRGHSTLRDRGPCSIPLNGFRTQFSETKGKNRAGFLGLLLYPKLLCVHSPSLEEPRAPGIPELSGSVRAFLGARDSASSCPMSVPKLHGFGRKV